MGILKEIWIDVPRQSSLSKYDISYKKQIKNNRIGSELIRMGIFYYYIRQETEMSFLFEELRNLKFYFIL